VPVIGSGPFFHPHWPKFYNNSRHYCHSRWRFAKKFHSTRRAWVKWGRLIFNLLRDSNNCRSRAVTPCQCSLNVPHCIQIILKRLQFLTKSLNLDPAKGKGFIRFGAEGICHSCLPNLRNALDRGRNRVVFVYIPPLVDWPRMLGGTLSLHSWESRPDRWSLMRVSQLGIFGDCAGILSLYDFSYYMLVL